MWARAEEGGFPMRYRLVTGGALLLLLALLAVAIAPGGAEGPRASAEARAPGTGTGSSSTALDPTASEDAALSGWVQDARGAPVAARVLAFEAGPAETQ